MENNKNDKVSIIIPVYNSEQYINKCLRNLIVDTSNSIEIILVDDGSTDNSPRLCDNFAKEYPFIKVVHTKNKGVAHARNVGLDLATGKWIAWLDSDDSVFDGYPEIITKLAKLDLADIYEFDYSVVNQNVVVDKKVKFDKSKLNSMTKKEAVLELPQHKYGNFLWCRLFRSKLFNNLRFPENNSCEDAFLMIDIYERANVFYKYSDNLYQYYYRKNSLSHKIDPNKNANFLKDLFFSNLKLTNKLKKLGYNDAYTYSKGELLKIAYHVENAIDYNKVQDMGEYQKTRKLLSRYKIYLSDNIPCKIRILLYIRKNMYWLYKMICKIVYGLKKLIY